MVLNFLLILFNNPFYAVEIYSPSIVGGFYGTAVTLLYVIMFFAYLEFAMSHANKRYYQRFRIIKVFRAIFYPAYLIVIMITYSFYYT